MGLHLMYVLKDYCELAELLVGRKVESRQGRNGVCAIVCLYEQAQRCGNKLGVSVSWPVS